MYCIGTPDLEVGNTGQGAVSAFLTGRGPTAILTSIRGA